MNKKKKKKKIKLLSAAVVFGTLRVKVYMNYGCTKNGLAWDPVSVGVHH